MRDSVSFLHRVSAWTEKVGMTDAESTLIKIAITITVAILIYIISRKWLSKLLKKVVGKTKSTWDDILYDQGFFRKLASLIPPFTAYIVLTFITWEYKYVLRRLVDIWLIIVTLFIITSLLNAINKIYESYPRDITDLEHAEHKVIWIPKDPSNAHHLWGPEIHPIAGKWYVYYAASDDNMDNHQLFVLENSSADPFEGEFELKGRISTDKNNNWAIHPNVFEHRGRDKK